MEMLHKYRYGIHHLNGWHIRIIILCDILEHAVHTMIEYSC